MPSSERVRRPIEPHELEHLRNLGQAFREMRRRAGVSCAQLSKVAVITPRQVERIEQGGRRTRRSTLERLVGAMVLAAPDLGDVEDLVDGLADLAGPGLAPESMFAAKSAARRQGKADRVAERRAMYAHLRA